MKTRYNTYDIICTIAELQKFIGMRVNNIYDIDNKTYLIRLQRTEEKQVLLLESGIRIHSTSFEWPKNVAPSGFSMKMRKHLKNKRLESLTQLGVDRIVDLTFGSGEAAYHVIIELFDRGNMLLTDYEYVILYVLRPHTEGDKIKFAVKEKYPLDRARGEGVISKEKMIELLESGKPGDQLKKILVPNLEYGPPLIEHVLRIHGFSGSTKIGKDFDIANNIDALMSAINEAEHLFQKSLSGHNEGYIIQKREERVATEANSSSEFLSNQEFHPILFEQHKSLPHKDFTSFNEAVDEFFSSLESQKLELRAMQQEKDAMKKLANVRKDHDQRLQALEKTQNVDKQKAELITRNQELVDNAVLVVQTLLANQVSWEDIDDMVKTAATKGEPVAKLIKQLKLEMNHISLHLVDPFEESNEDEKLPSMVVEIDLALSAFANARKYYDQKRSAAKKQQKTIESQSKALKSAERKTKQTLKEVQTITNINKARKVYWFEKFFWFVSSENYLVIAGRDQQQNELIVKRYMKPTDVYVHADIHGASSVIIKNPSGLPVPPKTLNEAGTMAICYSVAWDAKVVTNAYWVWGEQVSKTAPTGEYLSTGSFMIRGKKNFLPPTHLILGLSFLFRLEDGCVEKHKGERKVMTVNEDDALSSVASEEDANEVEVEVEVDDSDGDEDDKETDTNEDNKDRLGTENKLEDISEHSSDDENSQFPDTHIKIQHFAGTKMNLMTEHTQLIQKSNQDDNVIFLGDNIPVILKNNKKQTNNKNDQKNKNRINAPEAERVIENSKQVSKRGQKSKLKKIKEKYKDQDDEERKMRMEILQSSGTSKDTKKSKKHKDDADKRKPAPRPARAPAPREAGAGGEDGDDEPTVQADVDVIDALTGVPAAEDELLFAVPVVAPYNALSSYKFKVKLTPGTARRGKAAKTVVAIFLKDRSITPREKDLLKAVKDEQLARNIPGKVKLSAPKLQVNRK
ncbi:unnamed protein product [Phaedon cochleariae]|uniref:Nuclear export mediator factor NEMF homolog n=1 Tax=Phaedon cochleariae TaxID=80249 RepID=A0A9P0DQ07_PHACE|nr:unnamed protein product [Phaedon cochleariae]